MTNEQRWRRSMVQRNINDNILMGPYIRMHRVMHWEPLHEVRSVVWNSVSDAVMTDRHPLTNPAEAEPIRLTLERLIR